jgi:two-component system NtrC family sensor kinase
MEPSLQPNRRILVVDDNPAIHGDIRKLLMREDSGNEALEEMEAKLFGTPGRPPAEQFHIDSAYQGMEGLELVQRSLAAGTPYALAFVDMRMPPGWDGLETICRLWHEDPGLQVVICTAYSDYSWTQIVERLGQSDNLLVLKKPFDNIEVTQMVQALTEKWRLRRHMDAQLRSLDVLVRARTRELEEANARLKREAEDRQRAEAELRKAEHLAALGSLAAGVAHEINNPLSFICSNLEYVTTALEGLSASLGGQERVLDVCEALHEAREGAERVRRIVADMKTLSRTDRDRSSCDANAALEDALRTLAKELSPCARVVKTLGRLPRVEGDQRRLTQVFVNLLQNAAQAISPGNPDENEIRIRSWADETGTVSIEIADTGSGIAPDVLPKIFDPFFTTKPAGMGTGLGLAICYSIVSGLGGQIGVTSSQGIGTSFRVKLTPRSVPSDAVENEGQAA